MNDILQKIATRDMQQASEFAFDLAISKAAADAVLQQPFNAPMPEVRVIDDEAYQHQPMRIKLAIKHARKRAVIIEAFACWLSNSIEPKKAHYDRAIDIMASRGYLGKAAQQAVKDKVIYHPLPPRLRLRRYFQ